MNFYKYLSIATIIFATISCSKNDEQIELKKTNNSCYTTNYEIYSKQIQEVVINSLEDVEFKNFIKTEAVKQFDGDYDILLASTLDKPMNGNTKSETKTFGDFLYEKLNMQVKSSDATNDNILDSILKNCPLMQIAIPELDENSTENWNTESDDALVAILPTDFNENRYEYIEAFDANGTKHKLSLDELPSQPVIVISNNERLKIENIENRTKSGNSNFYYQNNYYTYNFRYLNNELQTTEATENQTKAYMSSLCDRDTHNGSDILKKGEFVNKSAFRRVESWPCGRPEFRVVVTYMQKINDKYETKSVDKYLSKSGWIKQQVIKTKLTTKNINVPIIVWDKNLFGSCMKYTWIEEDLCGDSMEININVSTKYDNGTNLSGTAKINISKNDDLAGESLVFYTDKTTGDGTWYNTGIVKFNIIQE